MVSLINLAVIKSAIAVENRDICRFSTINPGLLVPSGKPLANQLVTFTEAGGSPIQIDVTCERAAKLIVSEPIQVAGPELKPVYSFTIVTTTSSISTKSGDAPLNLPAGTTSLQVNLFVDKGSRLRAGNYSYTFKLNFLP